MNIPLIDLKEQYNSIKTEIDQAMIDIVKTSSFINGPELSKFENNFANYCKKGYCAATDNGTAALYIALKCLNIKEGDEVIIPAMTFIATAEAARMCGAKIVIADVNESGTMDLNTLSQRITAKTKAIIPVHLYGNVCDMTPILDVAKKFNLFVIEDCAQAHGSEYNGQRVPVGDIGCFSFFPGKNLGAYGDGGAIVSNNKDFISRCKKFSDHGRQDKYLHDTEGFNFRMDDLQSSVLNVKLKYLDNWLRIKREIANVYQKELQSYISIIKKNENVLHSYHLYVIRTKERDKLKDFLEKEGIKSGIHYPVPLHLQPALAYLGYKEGDFPIAEKLSKEVLSIPIYPELSLEKMYFITDKIKEFVRLNVNKF